MTTRDHAKGDPVVRRALDTLEAPEHRPGFWDDLDALLADATLPKRPRLAAVPDASTSTDVDATGGVADVDDGHAFVVTLDEVPATASPRRRAWRWLPVAAALALVAAIGAQMVSERDDSGPTLGIDGTTVLSPSTTETPASPTTTAVPAPPADLAGAQAAVLGFVDALGRDDLEAAAAMLGPRSESFLQNLAQPPEQFLGIVAGEGFGAWGRSADRQARTFEVAPGSAVVVLQGTLELEGTTETRADAFPVQHAESADAWFVDPWAYRQIDANPLDALLPLRTGDLRLSPSTPVAFTTASPGTAYFALDSRVVAQVHSDDQGHVTWVPVSELADGQHTLTVAFVADDGSVFSAIAMPARVGD